MDIKAFKMDGLGNDFIIIDNRQKVTDLTKEQIIKICDRDFIGCDQLILIENDNNADARLKFFNSDGGESGACGNGTRCVADLISKEKDNKTIILTICSFDKFVAFCLLSIIPKSLPNPSILKALMSIYSYLTYLLTF